MTVMEMAYMTVLKKDGQTILTQAMMIVMPVQQLTGRIMIVITMAYQMDG